MTSERSRVGGRGTKDSHRRSAITACLVLATLLGAMPARGAQTWRSKRLFFGDAHWHSCLSQDAARSTSLTGQYSSMLEDYGLDFSLESEHAEAASAELSVCLPYLPFRQTSPGPGNAPKPIPYSGEQIANAMKAAADEWNGAEHVTPTGTLKFVTFPGYEWAPDARCWQGSAGNPFPNDLNSDDSTPGHINYFFDRTTGWTYQNDVWEPGDGDSGTCSLISDLGFTYYEGSKDFLDEILGQLIHQRDDPDRAYDLMIQYNHPAASIDKGGSSDHLAKWFDFEHSDSECSVAEGGTPCTQTHCEAVRRAYGVTGVEWYAHQEASIGSKEQHLGGDIHDTFHVPERYVTSRGLREGYKLSEMGGSDSHGGRRSAPKGPFPGDRGAGARSLTVVQASDATRPAIWDGLTRRRTYALSRFREVGPVHKGRVDFFTPDPLVNAPPGAALLPGGGGLPRVEHGMGELIEAVASGTPRDFTIAAAAAEGTTGVFPLELRLYRVNATTPLSAATSFGFYWLDDVPGDPGKFGELLGRFNNATASPTLTHTFTNVVVRPGDAVFAVIPYSDSTWTDDFYDMNQQPLDADLDGQPDPGKRGFAHTDNGTWARTTPIFFQRAQEQARLTPACTRVTFNGSGSASPQADGGVDAGVTGDDGVLPIAVPNGYTLEWNRWRFPVRTNTNYVDLSFFTAADEDSIGHLFAIRIDGQLVYSGRAGIDHAAGVLVDKRNIFFPLTRGLHELEVHMDDQEYANGDNDPDFHCNDYDGPPAFLDAIALHTVPDAPCDDVTPPAITCPQPLVVECSAAGGVPATTAAVQAFLAAVRATDDLDSTPTLTHDAPGFFPTGSTTVTFSATDDAGSHTACSASVTVRDTRPPQLTRLTLAPSRLTPPNHKLRPISVPTLLATDVCDASPRIRCGVASNERPLDFVDGDVPVDIIFDGEPIATQDTGERQLTTNAGSGSFSLALRAERSASGSGRIYTATCVAVDTSQNRSSTQTATVTVRNRRRRGSRTTAAALDSTTP